MLALTLGVTSFRDDRATVAVGPGIAGGLASGVMAVVNFVIHCDFRWSV